eukprot:1228985-Rhodomonas_salina.1
MVTLVAGQGARCLHHCPRTVAPGSDPASTARGPLRGRATAQSVLDSHVPPTSAAPVEGLATVGAAPVGGEEPGPYQPQC